MTPPMALLAKWPGRRGTPVVIGVPEHKAPWFMSHGWRVVIRDSDLVPVPISCQSNPRRTITPREDA